MHEILQAVAGTWFVLATNFPMWLDGKKENPTFTYTVTEYKGTPALLDEVKYVKNGKTKTITGYDILTDSTDLHFRWRGKGLLAIAVSKWQIRAWDKENGLIALSFTKTAFTPAGMDIIARDKNVAPEVLQQFMESLQTDTVLGPQLGNLVRLE